MNTGLTINWKQFIYGVLIGLAFEDNLLYKIRNIEYAYQAYNRARHSHTLMMYMDFRL